MSSLWSVDERRAMDHIHETLFSAQGIVDTLVGPLLFLILFKTVGLDAALIGAGAAALAVVALRAVRGQRLTSAWYGVAGGAPGGGAPQNTRRRRGPLIPEGAGKTGLRAGDHRQRQRLLHPEGREQRGLRRGVPRQRADRQAADRRRVGVLPPSASLLGIPGRGPPGVQRPDTDVGERLLLSRGGVRRADHGR